MWTYNITKTKILPNGLYADYTFDLLFNDMVVSTNTIYGINIENRESVFADLTANLIIE